MSSSHSCSLSLLLCPSHSVSSPAAAALASNTPGRRGFSCCHPQGVTQTLLHQQQNTEQVQFHRSTPQQEPRRDACEHCASRKQGGWLRVS